MNSISESLPLILEPAALAEIIPAQRLLLVAVCQQQVFLTQHIPGSVLITPAELVAGSKPATGKLPSVEQLSEVFSRIGLTEDSHVIAYDDEGGGWAGRLIWTLDVLGHRNYSYLNGGLIAWIKGGYACAAGEETVAPTDFQATIDRTPIAELQEVLEQIGNPDSIVWDARAPEEYRGEKITAARNGHIPGAVNLDWVELMDRDNDLRLLALPDIAKLLESRGISRDKKIITHCQTHHRSGLSYLVGKALGLDIRAYDGSWSEWGNQTDTPIET